MNFALQRVGFYVSPIGGAPAPALIGQGNILFELITAGSVYSPDGQLCHPGWMFCHTAGEHTVWRSDPGSHYECLTINFELAHVLRPETWPRAVRWDDAEAAVTFAHEILYAFHHRQVSREILGDLIWSQLRFKLDQYKRAQARQALPPPISAAIKYLEIHFAQEISIAKLAAAAEISASHLHAQFRRHTGVSPHQYVINRRMREARQLLVTTTEPIKAISASVGYANAENFCRAFRKHAKTTAASYRRKYTQRQC